MIKRIILSNFFSFQDTQTIDLNPGVNILLGINGSGKTSFINAFRLLYEGVCGMGFEKQFQSEWGGYNEVVNLNSDHRPDYIGLTFVFDCERLKVNNSKSPFKNDVYYSIVVRPFGEIGYTIEEKLYSENLKEPSKPFVFLDFKNEKGRLSVYHSTGIRTEKYAGQTSGTELILRQISDPKRYLPLHTLKTAVEKMALYESFDTTANSDIRKPTVANSDVRLNSKGTNLISVLCNIKRDFFISYKNINSYLKKINNSFDALDFQPFGSRLYMFLQEANMRKAIGMRFISDGTLKYILMLAIFLNDKVGCFVGIDEPEGRLHPDMIHSIAQLIKAFSQHSQVIVATHSPLLLNDFDLEDILVFEKNAKTNSTTIKRYSEEDFTYCEGDILPGQLWLDGEIGGKRW